MTREGTIDLWQGCEAARAYALAQGKTDDGAHEAAKLAWNGWATSLPARESLTDRDWQLASCLDFSGLRFEAQSVAPIPEPAQPDATGLRLSVLSNFAGCRFPGPVAFSNAIFSGDAGFENATFSGQAKFGVATFSKDTSFDSAIFSGYAWFRNATFSGEAWFGRATFSGRARFGIVTFSGATSFGQVSFAGG